MIFLSLRSNQIHGSIPEQLCDLAKLQVVDFSYNKVTGKMLNCHGNITAMAQTESSTAILTYPLILLPQMSILVLHSIIPTKYCCSGKTDMYKNTLGLVKSIDFSSNKIAGEISEEITRLTGLISLNLSSNTLTGQIPAKIGELTLLNSLDLSSNKLNDKIPESFSQLGHLGVLDLSNNNLSGKIPLTTQLQNFDASSYTGNPELCGSPLPKKCKEDESSQDPAIGGVQDNEEGFIGRGFYVSIIVGFIVGFWGFCGTLVFIRTWRHAYFSFINYVTDSLYVFVAVNFTHVRRRLRS